MLNFLLSAAVGLICGVLSGFGVGGGTLLMVFLSTVAAMPQLQAQGVNLLYFLPSAACALIFHAKGRRLVWPVILPAALAGCATAALGALCARNVDTALLQKLFGGFLCLVGLTEIFLKGLKK